ncbi:hypothetical protein ALC56_02975, partial [Trachymyrmex septentrionalis]
GTPREKKKRSRFTLYVSSRTISFRSEAEEEVSQSNPEQTEETREELCARVRTDTANASTREGFIARGKFADARPRKKKPTGLYSLYGLSSLFLAKRSRISKRAREKVRLLRSEERNGVYRVEK